jgi:hypothetical protein
MHGEAGRQEQTFHVPDQRSEAGLAVGAAVCVWNYYLQAWSGGFVVAETLPLGYRLRRLSDRQVLDHVFSAEEVMADRRVEQLPGFEGTQRDRRRITGQAPGE